MKMGIVAKAKKSSGDAMKTQQRFTKGYNIRGWILTSFLGKGGNGEVWSCKNLQGAEAAIKILRKVKPKSYSRFKDETTVLEQVSDIEGIIRIHDKFLPVKLGKHFPFYVMPLAKKSEDVLKYSSAEERVDAIIQIAETLAKLHRRNIYHRDIKPANILFYDSGFALADFGLVDYPNKKEISKFNEEIGAKWTLAPEMRRKSSTSDPGPADIYSLAKTLWIFLTEQIKGFDGQYSDDSIISLNRFLPNNFTAPIDGLLIRCTDNDPLRRPSIDQFINILRNWQKLVNSFHEKKLEQWKELQTKLFPISLPSRVIWTEINDIIQILKIICSYGDITHFFFPVCGSLDLKDVRVSHEKDCLEFDFGQIHVIKPHRLIFESFGYHHEWNYFRLEARELMISKVNEGTNNLYFEEFGSEELTELAPGQYYPLAIYANETSYEQEHALGNMRRVRRWLRGSFVLFCKSSAYNLTQGTNNGWHNEMSAEDFRFYMLRMLLGVQNYYKEFSKVNGVTSPDVGPSSV